MCSGPAKQSTNMLENIVAASTVRCGVPALGLVETKVADAREHSGKEAKQRPARSDEGLCMCGGLTCGHAWGPPLRCNTTHAAKRFPTDGAGMYGSQRWMPGVICLP
jgi:hypothetical protein